MKALISPQEQIYINNVMVGSRIADVSNNAFDVAEPLFWVNCNNSIIGDQYYYSTDKIITVISKLEPTSKPSPTLEQLQAQLAIITTQMAALANTGA